MPRQPITAKLVASMLEQAGANRVVTFDLHAAQIQGFFHCPVDDLTTVPMMGQYFKRKHLDPEQIVVVSPDHGGVKRARIMAEMLGSPLAIIEDGDMIEIDVKNRTIHLDLPEEVIEERLKHFKFEFPEGEYPPFLRLFSKNVGSMAKGGVWEL